MTLDKYDLEAKRDYLNFEFTSDGPKGKIRKIIRFEKLISQDDIYNLGFGDYDKTKNDVDDLSISNNRDVSKILATVSSAFLLFMDKNPNATVIIKGSTTSRMRLFSREISKYLKEIHLKFELWGTLDGHRWEILKRNIHYHSILLRRK